MARFFSLLLGLIFYYCQVLAAPDAPQLSQRHPAFVPNKGQVHDPSYHALPQVLYQFSGSGLNISLTKNAIHYTFIRELSSPSPKLRKATPFDTTSTQYTCLGLTVQLLHANPLARITQERQQDFYQNLYLSGCGEKGINKLHGYEQVTYHDIYPNIDWVLYTNPTNPQSIKYDFVLRPGARAQDIQLQCSEGGTFALHDDGSLAIKTALGQIREAAPYSYGLKSKNTSPCSFQLGKDNILSFNTINPTTEPLVIDPQVIWATYFGGNKDDGAQNIAVDDEGNLYIVGRTTSTANLASFAAHQSTYGGHDNDAYLAKFSPKGQPIWCTYLGGAAFDGASDIAIDTFRHIYMVGYTGSTNNIATSGAFQAIKSGYGDGFFARFDKAGALVYCSYYGGNDHDGISTVSVDNLGNFYIAGGTTSSNNIATSGSFKASYSALDSGDGFFAKFDSSGSRIFGSYFGGTGVDDVYASTMDQAGNLILTGYTTSQSDIATPGVYQDSMSSFVMGGQSDAFVVKFSPNGTRIWGSYFGSELYVETGEALCTDTLNNIYLLGIAGRLPGSTATTLATPLAYQTGIAGRSDLVLVKFDKNGQRVWCSYYGGSDFDCYSISSPWASEVVPISHPYPKWRIKYIQNKLWLAGNSQSMDAMASPGSYQDTLHGTFNAVIACFDTAGRHRLWASYFGDTSLSFAAGLVENGPGAIYVAGFTNAPKNIVSDSALQYTLDGKYDAFLLKIVDSLSALHLYGVRSYCVNDTFSVGYHITQFGTQRAGNQFIAELSDSSGSFALPTPLGFNSSRVGGFVHCTLPSGVFGKKYKIRIRATLPVLISDTQALVINPYPKPTISQSGSVLSTGVYDSYQWYLNGNPIPGATKQHYTASSKGNYTVKVSLGACSGSSVPFIATQVSPAIGQSLSQIELYPNPSSEQINILHTPANCRLDIADISGRTLSHTTLNAGSNTITIGTLPNGLYQFIITTQDGFKKTFKVLKR